jgi:hypothetical protein
VRTSPPEPCKKSVNNGSVGRSLVCQGINTGQSPVSLVESLVSNRTLLTFIVVLACCTIISLSVLAFLFLDLQAQIARMKTFEGLERQIGTSSDDCERVYVPDFFSLTMRGETVGVDNTTWYKYGTGLRFTNIVIPKGSTIRSAYLKLCAHDTLSGTIVNTHISAWATDNASTFTDKTDFDNRYGNRTAARVNWDNIGSWQVSSWYMSPGISAVVQELVNRPNWASGNSIVFFFEDFDGRSTLGEGVWRDFSSYDVNPEISAKLYVNWTAP